MTNGPHRNLFVTKSRGSDPTSPISNTGVVGPNPAAGVASPIRVCHGDVMDDFSRREGVALVTGGTGGLGAAVSTMLAERGSDVAFTYRADRDRANDLVARIENHDRMAVCAQLDLTDAAAVATVVDGLGDLGGIHTLVHAAGPTVPQVHLSTVEPGDFAHHVNQELVAFFNVVQPALASLRTHGGSIVAITSAATDRYAIRDGLSAGPKSGIEALVRGLAAEEGRFGVRANAVGPGMLTDGMAERLISLGHYSERDLDVARNNIALRTFGTAADIAEAVCFLASDRAGYVSGQVLNVDGGYSV